MHGCITKASEALILNISINLNIDFKDNFIDILHSILNAL